MNSFSRYKNRINVLGTGIHERATNEGIRNYDYYLKNAGNRLELAMTDVGEPYITDKTKIVACTMRDVKFNDTKNFDQKVITVPATTNVGVGCYVMWEGRNYLIIYEQHKEVPTHKTYVIRFCNSFFHCYDDDGNVVEVPMSSHDLTLYSNGLRDGKFLDYENGKRKVLIGANPLTEKNIKVGQRVFFSKFNTFKITSIDDYSMEGVFAMMFEQTLNEPEDNPLNQITNQQQADQPVKETLPPMPPVPVTNQIVITGSNIKVGMSGEFTISNCDDKEVVWSINVPSKVATLTQSSKTCTITANSNGKLIGTEIEITASVDNKTVATKNIEIVSLF